MPENEFFFDVLRQQQAIWVENFLQDHKSEEFSSSNDDNNQKNTFLLNRCRIWSSLFPIRCLLSKENLVENNPG